MTNNDNGLKQQNIEKFDVWEATKSNADFQQMVRRGVLNRTEIAKEAGIGKSALTKNDVIKKTIRTGRQASL